jgi:translation initiation factor IF-3
MAIRRKKTRPENKPRLPQVDRNYFIKAPSVLVIDENGENLGILKTSDALEMAKQRELDLVLISPAAVPPVAKIVSWSKYKFDLSKKKKAQKGKTSEQKGMWIKPFIDEADLAHKLKRVKEFLDKGDKVKLEIRRVRGRRTEYSKMQETANKIMQLVSEFGEVDGGIKKEGANISIYVKPKK